MTMQRVGSVDRMEVTPSRFNSGYRLDQQIGYLVAKRVGEILEQFDLDLTTEDITIHIGPSLRVPNDPERFSPSLIEVRVSAVIDRPEAA